MRGPEVEESEPFRAAARELREQYPELRAAIEEFKRALKLGYNAPKQRVSSSTRQVYVEKMDYEPLGDDGRSRFVVVYHATLPTPSMNQPLQTFTLVTIFENTERLN